jgi:putative transposase
MRNYRTYDHRIKEMIVESGDPSLFPSLDIPRSTATSWIRKGLTEGVTLPALNQPVQNLVQENERLRKELTISDATQKLTVFTFRVFGFQIQYQRLPSSESKDMILGAIEGASKFLSLKGCLEVIGLTSARYHSWKKKQASCRLTDMISCPRLMTSRLTLDEISKIRDYATSEYFAHYSIMSLSWAAKKAGDLYASATTWSRVIRDLKLRRPGKRVYPAKPKIGVRASAPNRIWHLDLTVIKLVDGTRSFIQCVIDNYSRYVVAHSVSLTYGGIQTKSLLEKALSHAKDLTGAEKPLVFVDSGTENINSDVEKLIENGMINRIIAGIEIEFSNSIVEALFRRLKHAYLYLTSLSSFSTLVSKTDYYLGEHNNHIPHSALSGATPIEVFLESWTNKKIQILRDLHFEARRKRIQTNRSVSCGACPV